MNTRDPQACGQQTTDSTALPTLAHAKNALAQVHEQTQQNARKHRLPTDALIQVPHKTPQGTKEC